VLEDFADLFDDLADERLSPVAPPEELRPFDTDTFTSSVQPPTSSEYDEPRGANSLQYRLPNLAHKCERLTTNIPVPKVRRGREMSAESKPVPVVTCPTPLASLPPDVAERVDRDYVVRRAETPEPLTSDGLVELSDGASGFLVTPFDRIDASFLDRVADSAYEAQQLLRSGE
jgi:hypothetical protein